MQTSGRFLLDTNIIIALFAGESSIHEHLQQAEETFLSSIALGELYFGAWKSSQIEKNLMCIDEFAAIGSVLVCDTDTAREYGIVKNSLRVKGRPIPENDIWIAAIARQYRLTLVTRDTHFSEIEELMVERW